MEDNKVSESVGNDSLKNITNVIKGVAGNFGESGEVGNGGNTGNNENCGEGLPGTAFKVASTNLPEKTGFWTKVKNILFYEIKVELTPYQQKIEDEINEFLHQEITWKSLKEAALSEVPITFRGKRIF
jgi:hypothetical protein